MFCAIDSVTIGVGSLDASLRFFRDRLGMRVVNDTRASVGLVAAWRRPVHESVRLVDLASAGSITTSAAGGRRTKPAPASSKTLPSGRVRLAIYEDSALTAAPRDASGDQTIPPTSGPWAIELSQAASSASGRTGGKGSGTNQSTTGILRSPDNLPLLGIDAAESASTEAGVSLSALWISSGNPIASSRFYTEALGLSVVTDSQSSARVPNITERVTFGYGDSAHPRIVLASFGSPTSEPPLAASMAVGQLSFNLITARCDDLDELQKRLEALGIKPITEPAHVGMPFGYPGRVMIVAGPNGELFEFDEIVV
jgi:catechol 2,3-dioxygenase-like lactoylglutathione lyase family enzyme